MFIASKVWCRVGLDPSLIYNTTGCLKIREFRIQSVVGRDPVEPEKFALPEA
jgi:hypothetical protein